MKILLILLVFLNISHAQDDPFTLYEKNLEKKTKKLTLNQKKEIKWELTCLDSGKRVPGFEKLLLKKVKSAFTVYEGTTITGDTIIVPIAKCYLKSSKK